MNDRSRAGPVLALVIALGLSVPGSGFAATVALIKSGPLAPYEQAGTAFSSTSTRSIRSRREF